MLNIEANACGARVWNYSTETAVLNFAGIEEPGGRALLLCESRAEPVGARVPAQNQGTREIQHNPGVRGC
jgi:hypothetical protein